MRAQFRGTRGRHKQMNSQNFVIANHTIQLGQARKLVLAHVDSPEALEEVLEMAWIDGTTYSTEIIMKELGY